MSSACIEEEDRNPYPLSSPSLSSILIHNLEKPCKTLVDYVQDYPFDCLTPPLYHYKNREKPIGINRKVWFKWLMQGWSQGKHYYETSAKDPTSRWHPVNLSRFQALHPFLEAKQFGLAKSYIRIKREIEPPQEIPEDPRIEEIIRNKRIKIEHQD